MDPTITLSMRIGAATRRRSSVNSASSVAKPFFWISAQSLLNSFVEVFVFLVYLCSAPEPNRRRSRGCTPFCLRGKQETRALSACSLSERYYLD